MGTNLRDGVGMADPQLERRDWPAWQNARVGEIVGDDGTVG